MDTMIPHPMTRSLSDGNTARPFTFGSFGQPSQNTVEAAYLMNALSNPGTRPTALLIRGLPCSGTDHYARMCSNHVIKRRAAISHDISNNTINSVKTFSFEEFITNVDDDEESQPDTFATTILSEWHRKLAPAFDHFVKVLDRALSSACCGVVVIEGYFHRAAQLHTINNVCTNHGFDFYVCDIDHRIDAQINTALDVNLGRNAPRFSQQDNMMLAREWEETPAGISRVLNMTELLGPIHIHRVPAMIDLAAQLAMDVNLGDGDGDDDHSDEGSDPDPPRSSKRPVDTAFKSDGNGMSYNKKRNRGHMLWADSTEDLPFLMSYETNGLGGNSKSKAKPKRHPFQNVRWADQTGAPLISKTVVRAPDADADAECEPNNSESHSPHNVVFGRVTPPSSEQGTPSSPMDTVSVDPSSSTRRFRRDSWSEGAPSFVSRVKAERSTERHDLQRLFRRKLNQNVVKYEQE